MSPYDEGYIDGQNDVYDNPFPFGTEDFDEYEDGYWDGKYDDRD